MRNAAYRRSGIGIRERHNERKNLEYTNSDIIINRKGLNVHYKSCEETYSQAFDRMVANGTISTRGLRDDAKVFDEMVFDVNTAYFDENGGYDYARRFFEEAYRMAVSEAGGEQYILSAVMHADERNKALSEQLGRDVFHYHLHVVYVPIVEKEIRWSKRCKDKALVGTVKDVIRQVSHSKKWSSVRKTDDHGNIVRTKDGNAILINSYSLLQDRFYRHMRDAGFRGFERGERGSTTEHLDVIEYKVAREQERAAGLAEVTARQERETAETQAALDEQRRIAAEQERAIIERQAEISRIGREAQERARRIAEATEFRQDIRKLGIPNRSGNVEVDAREWERISGLAVAGYLTEPHINDLYRTIRKLESTVDEIRRQIRQLAGSREDFLQMCRDAPLRIWNALLPIRGKERGRDGQIK